MAFSYASYAGNGSNKNFSVPFPYLLKAHVKVYTGFNILDGTYTSLLVEGTDYTWTSGTQVQTTVAPANGVTLTVLRDTPDSSQLVPWTDGSNLVSNDLNTADLQNLYVVQEQQDRNDAGITQSTAAQTAANAATTAANTATSTANTALSTANTALTNANAAVSTANTASTNASAAVSTANTAASNASAAVSTANTASSTANTASTNASNAVTTANAAAATAATALSTANTAATNASAAVSTANTASSNASAAVTTANTASTNASNAVTTANTANTNASAAVTTANTASTNASNAVTTANAADNKANQAIAAVSNSINYQLKANVAAIPASPANDTYIEVQDSTGLESFTPLAGMPAGFVGDAGLSVRLRYTTAGTTWNWLNYYANNSDSRYLKLVGGTLTGQIKADDSTSAATPGYAFDGDPNTGIGRPGADELALITGGTARLTIDSSGSVAVTGALTKGGNNVVTVGDTGTVTNTMLAGSIDASKVTGTAITAADTGTVTSTMVADGTLVNADINASAAIAGTKISPDFGSQNTTTTGTSTAASFIPTSSTAPSNGVYLPSANNVAISTNGSGRLFIDSSGRLGVGASSPSTALHVATTGAGIQEVQWLRNGQSVAADVGSALVFTGTTNDNGLARISGAFAGAATTDGGYMAFSTRAVTSGALTERMRITAGGNVGLGTSSASYRLDVSGGIRAKIDSAGDGTGVLLANDGSSNGRIEFLTNDGTGRYRMDGIGDTRFAISTISSGVWAEAISINRVTRNVGVGDNAPSTNLVLSGAGSSIAGLNAHFLISDSTAAAAGVGGSMLFEGKYLSDGSRAVYAGISGTKVNSTNGNYQGQLKFYTRPDGQLPAVAMTIDSSQRVGIGTATPGTRLHIKQSGDTYDTALSFEAASSSTRRLYIGVNHSTGTGVVGTDSNDLTLDAAGSRSVIFNTNNLQRAQIDPSGRLLVGTSTARTNLFGSQSSRNLTETAGTYIANAAYIHNDSSSAGAEICLAKTRGTTVGSNTVVQSGDDIGGIFFAGADGTNIIAGASIRAAVDATPGTNDMPGRLTFSTTADGASSPTERMRIQANGAILFGSTSESFISDNGVKILYGGNKGYLGQVFSSTSSADTVFVGYSTGDSSYKYYFKGNGGLNNYSGNNVNLSDEREKKNIVNLDSTWDCLKHWELKKFHYNEDADTDAKRYGVIAQQVQEYCPEVVADWKKDQDKDGNPITRLGVKEQQMMWMAIKALQEAQLRIETLEAEVAALKGA